MSRAAHPLNQITQQALKKYTKEQKNELKNTIVQWIYTELGTTKCKRAKCYGDRVSKCDCMETLFANPQQNKAIAKKAAAYLLFWKSASYEYKRTMIYNWYGTANMIKNMTFARNWKCYILQVAHGEDVGDEEEVDEVGVPLSKNICRHALMTLLDIGDDLWKTAIENPTHINTLKGKKGVLSNKGKSNAEMYDSLSQFFENLKEEALPFATRIVRDESGTNTRDDDPDEIAIPPHLTKHKCYSWWCYERGWKVKKFSSAQTIYTKTADYEVRDDWPDNDPKKICTWPTFRSFWQKHFPKLVVRGKGSDTCTDCLVLRNQFRTRAARLERTNMFEQRRGTNDDEREGDVIDNNDEEQSSADENDNNQNMDLERELELTTEVLTKAKLHVKSYVIQRDYKKTIVANARNDITYQLSSVFRRKVFTIDMGQNLSLPSFESEQPGDTYYLTPLTVLLFGIVDNAPMDGKERMDAFIWREFEGDRGANNIVSCLVKFFKMKIFFSAPNYDELTLIADNCGGQNKNRVMIRFITWLAEIRVFPKITLHFLVKGHTKNSADRCFNLLKHTYRNSNIYTYDELYDVLNRNQYVNVIKMEPNEFQDHDSWQDTMYRATDSGVKQTHVFTVYASNPGRLYKQDHAEAAIRFDELLPTKRNKKAKVYSRQERNERLAMERVFNELQAIDPTPLRPIKQVELWQKWGPLLPNYAREITCPKPSDEVISQIKKERNEKATKARESKKRKQLDNIDM
jgi:hypothetical protein